MNPKVDTFLKKAKTWQKEITQLRKIMLECGLTEELKWGWPCYALDGSNIVLIHSFKEYCALLFFKGALLSDPKKVLVQQTKNVQSARQMRFTSVQQINKMKATIKDYVRRATDAEKAGLKVELKTADEFEVAEEFQRKLDKSASLKKAFKALTPGRQKGYLLHFAAAKQPKTRESRVEKAIPDIMAGKGLNDR